MKRFFCCLLLCVAALGTITAQRTFDSARADSSELAKGLIPLEFKMLLPHERFCFNVPWLIDNDSTLLLLKEKCPPAGIDSFNINTHILLNEYFGGDCHVRFIHRVYLDTTHKAMIWKVYAIWGGCRAGGGERFVLMAPKPPVGYTIKVEEVLADDYNTY